MFTESDYGPIATLITELFEIQTEKLIKIKKEFLLGKKTVEPVFYTRTKVAKLFEVTGETISSWCDKKEIDPSCYLVINRIYKFHKEKIDELTMLKRQGVWDPSARRGRKPPMDSGTQD
jgi:hypothetical protein